MCAVDTNEFSRFIQGYNFLINQLIQFINLDWVLFSFVESTNEVNAIDVSIRGNYIASGGKDAALRLYDAESAKVMLFM